MAKLKLDKDTEKVLSDGQKIYDFKMSPGWALVKTKLLNKVVMNDSLSAIVIRPGATNEEMLRELIGRAQASKLVLEWINEIEGTANQHKDNQNAMEGVREDIFFRVGNHADDDVYFG